MVGLDGVFLTISPSVNNIFVKNGPFRAAVDNNQKCGKCLAGPRSGNCGRSQRFNTQGPTRGITPSSDEVTSNQGQKQLVQVYLRNVALRNVTQLNTAFAYLVRMGAL